MNGACVQSCLVSLKPLNQFSIVYVGKREGGRKFILEKKDILEGAMSSLWTQVNTLYASKAMFYPMVSIYVGLKWLAEYQLESDEMLGEQCLLYAFKRVWWLALSYQQRLFLSLRLFCS